MAGIGPERLDRFFTLKPEGYQISQTLREGIVFAPHNLIRDAPFTKLDLITCRNLLIYFQPHAQKTGVLTLFHFALKPDGFLLLTKPPDPERLERLLKGGEPDTWASDERNPETDELGREH